MYVRQRAPNRRHCTDQAHDFITRRTCLHVDAWLYEDQWEQLYIHIEYSVAGKQLYYVETNMIVFDGYSEPQQWELRPVTPLTQSQIQSMIPRYIGNRWSRIKAPYLADVERRLITPLIWRPMGAAFKGYRSVALHYVYTDMNICEPMAGILNEYGVTGYHTRFVDKDIIPLPSAMRDKAKPERLPPRERSIMRTLDKVLRNSNST